MHGEKYHPGKRLRNDTPERVMHKLAQQAEPEYRVFKPSQKIKLGASFNGG